MASRLDNLEGAFHHSPSLQTADTWHRAAIEAYRTGDIQITELFNIGDAVRTWCRVNNIPTEISHASPCR